MAQDEVNERKTNSQWLRNQNEYDLLLNAQRRIDSMKYRSCIIYVLTGSLKCAECDEFCKPCLQKWLNETHRFEAGDPFECK